MTRPPLSTTNLILRDFLLSDLPAYQTLRSDKRFLRFSSEEESAAEKPAQLLQLFLDQGNEVPRTRFQLAITLKDGTLIGSCGVRIETPGVASIGCEVGRHWQGSGLAREAGRAMVAFGFMDLHLDKIYAETIPENLAAIRLCHALGLRQTHVLRNHRRFKGRGWDTVILELARAEFEKGAVPRPAPGL